MIGQTVGHYRILDKLGEGGMGVVYLAEDTTLGRMVALKVLPPELADDPERLERFQREARTLAALDHPNIVTIHTVESAPWAETADAADGPETIHFLTMQLIEGERLSDLIPAGGMLLDRIFEVAIPLADALATAHAKGIVHRDLKPGNVMVGAQGQVKVLDFGLAKLRDEAAAPMATQLPTEPLTGEGRILGTVPYMSPEQLEGKELDGRTDVFSLGVMLYEMATGERPFRGTSSASLILSIGRDTPRAVDALRPDLPHHLGRVIGRCLEKDPELRFQTVKDVRNELRSLERETDSRSAEAVSGVASGSQPAAAIPASPGSAPASGPSAPATDKRARRPVVMLAAVLLVVAAVIAAVVFWRGRSPGESASRAAPEAAAEVQSVAVLPFSNLSGRPEIDYLALAVPDEITTALSYGYDLEVRPFSLTRKYQGPAIDPQAAGREVRATSVVTGQYGVEGDRLQVTLEAIDVEANSLIWRQRLSVEADDPLALRQVVAATVGEALLPALGGRTEEAIPAAPSNPEAYRLYLESLAISRDPEPNRRAIPVLERVVELDPGFAGAWTALAERWAFEGYYGGGSSAEQKDAMEKSERAARRALELNPNDLAATLSLSHRILEMGRMGEAYEIAARLLAQNPDRGKAHFMVSYIYRYVGLLEEAAAECNRALELSPTDVYLRSCVITFYRLGDFDRARDFLALDADTEWAYTHEGSLRLYDNDLEAAVRLYGTSPNFKFFPLLEACLADPESEATRAGLAAAIDVVQTDPDPEFRYHATALMAVCGFGEEALEYLPIVAEAGYCVPDVFNEAPFRSLAGQPGSQEAQAAHTACRDRFLAAKSRVDAGLPPA